MEPDPVETSRRLHEELKAAGAFSPRTLFDGATEQGWEWANNATTDDTDVWRLATTIPGELPESVQSVEDLFRLIRPEHDAEALQAFVRSTAPSFRTDREYLRGFVFGARERWKNRGQTATLVR